MHPLCLALALLVPPSPEPPPASPSPVGSWSMTWHGTTAPAVFFFDGTYRCNWVDSQVWQGTWTLVGDDLTVHESPPGTTPVTTSWTARMKPGTLRGDWFELKAKGKGNP